MAQKRATLARKPSCRAAVRREGVSTTTEGNMSSTAFICSPARRRQPLNGISLLWRAHQPSLHSYLRYA